MNEPAPPPQVATVLSVQAFLYREARLLDEYRLDEWRSLFTADALYVLPVRDGPPPEPAIIRDTRQGIDERVYRLTQTLAHAQNPPSRTQHDITNVELLTTSPSGELLVACNQAVHELRCGDVFQIGLGDPRTFHARCRYRLVATDASWQIREKRCELLDRDYPIYNLTFLF